MLQERVGVTLTRWIGIDDSITGVWIAALLGSMSFWFSTWLLIKAKPYENGNTELRLNHNLRSNFCLNPMDTFYKFQLIIRMSQLFGLDKLTFGMITGEFCFT